MNTYIGTVVTLATGSLLMLLYMVSPAWTNVVVRMSGGDFFAIAVISLLAGFIAATNDEA